MKPSIGVIGVGMVGGAIAKYYKNLGYEVYPYDPPKGIGTKEEVNKADIVFVAVPTPYSADGGGYDLNFVNESLDAVGAGKAVILKSTLLPGTAEALKDKYPSIDLVFSPEFLSEATAEEDFSHPDLQVIGIPEETERWRGITKKLEEILPKGDNGTLVCKYDVAEAIKVVRNVLYATKVVAINDIFDILTRAGIDYDAVKEGLRKSKMISPTHLDVFHKGGRGAGGKCLPKELGAFVIFAKNVGISNSLFVRVKEINDRLLERYPKK